MTFWVVSVDAVVNDPVEIKVQIVYASVMH